jgi:hypothetical protein
VDHLLFGKNIAVAGGEVEVIDRAEFLLIGDPALLLFVVGWDGLGAAVALGALAERFEVRACLVASLYRMVDNRGALSLQKLNFLFDLAPGVQNYLPFGFSEW